MILRPFFVYKKPQFLRFLLTMNNALTVDK